MNNNENNNINSNINNNMNNNMNNSIQQLNNQIRNSDNLNNNIDQLAIFNQGTSNAQQSNITEPNPITPQPTEQVPSMVTQNLHQDVSQVFSGMPQNNDVLSTPNIPVQQSEPISVVPEMSQSNEEQLSQNISVPSSIEPSAEPNLTVEDKVQSEYKDDLNSQQDQNNVQTNNIASDTDTKVQSNPQNEELHNEQSKKSKNSIAPIIIVLLVIAILGVVVYICYDKGVFDKKDSTNNNETNAKIDNEISKGETKDFDLKEAEHILDEFGFSVDIGCGSNIYDSFYSESFKQTIALKKVSDSVKTEKKCSEIYSELWENNSNAYKGENGVCFKDKETIITPYEEANKIYMAMYGIDMPKKGFTTSNVSGMYYNLYDYNESLNSFVQLECGSCGGACGPSMTINKIKSAYTIEDNLVIDVYYFHTYELSTSFVGPEMKEEKYISTSHNQIKLESKDLESAKKEIEEKYLDKLDVYEVIFTMKNGNYIFKSLNQKES